MTANAWLRATIPIQGALLLSQLITGLNADDIPYRVYEIVHTLTGILLVILVAIHLALNWGWVRKQYGGRR